MERNWPLWRLGRADQLTIKPIDRVLIPDQRFAHLAVLDAEGFRPMGFDDHYSSISRITIGEMTPIDVLNAFDRARNVMIYAFFEYDLFVVGEVQAFGALELALKHRLNGHGGSAKGTLRNLTERARKQGILPAEVKATHGCVDPISALIGLRNELSHGTSAVHSPGMALPILEACAHWIDHVQPT